MKLITKALTEPYIRELSRAVIPRDYDYHIDQFTEQIGLEKVKDIAARTAAKLRSGEISDPDHSWNYFRKAAYNEVKLSRHNKLVDKPSADQRLLFV